MQHIIRVTSLALFSFHEWFPLLTSSPNGAREIDRQIKKSNTRRSKTATARRSKTATTRRSKTATNEHGRIAPVRVLVFFSDAESSMRISRLNARNFDRRPRKNKTISNINVRFTINISFLYPLIMYTVKNKRTVLRASSNCCFSL